MVNDVNVEIHGVKFKADFVVLDYVNEGEPSILFGRDFLATTKIQVNFGLGEIRVNLTKFEKGIDVIDLLEEVGSSSEEVVKMGKANRNKGYNINKLTPPYSLRIEEIPPTSTILPQPIYYPLTPKQKEKMKEILDIKYKELEESKPILEVLENYVVYKKKLDEILIGKERLNKKEFSEEDKVGIIEHGLPKKMCDPENYVLPVKINGVVERVALVDIRASAMGEVKNVRIQIGYQAYVVDLLILDILVDPELPLLLGRPFLRTCGAIIDMGRGEDDWLGSFEVGRDEDGNVKYGHVAPSFIDIEDDMERALAMEAYFNPFKNVIMFKKLVDFLGLLPVQLKNLDWGNEGYGTYKKVDGDGDWHARFEIVTPSGRKFNRAFKTKTTTRKLSRKFKTKDVLRSPIMILIEKSRKDTLPNPLIAEYERRNKRNTITYSLQPVSNANLKWRDFPSVERHAYCEKLPIWNSKICTLGHKHVVWIGRGKNVDRKDDRQRKEIKNVTLRRDCIAAQQRARLDCRPAQVFAAWQDHDNTHGIIGVKATNSVINNDRLYSSSNKPTSYVNAAKTSLDEGKKSPKTFVDNNGEDIPVLDLSQAVSYEFALAIL
ncbi:retrovirus-related pol polyprotein from transposon TNT 1-94, partial [Tanacetum coccineum]